MGENFFQRFRELFNLRSDTDYEKTDESIRNNVDFRSANAWTLVFAIFIASVGLNVNSTAVIIGAMLISPLMGPIVGAGYSLGVNDFGLLKRSGRNILIAVGISLITSTLFFLVSPFDEAQSELLARTAPNFYDVLIAAFGGAAGIVALSRKEKSNAIPGVAIATALMPPLCTAGFGIANLEWKYCLGALYLFVINSVFICLSTYVFVRSLKFKKVSYSDKAEQTRIDRYIIGVASVVIVPSIVTAWLLLEESKFFIKANAFIEKEVRQKGTFVIDKRVRYTWNNAEIDVSLVGEKLSKRELKALEEKKNFYGLAKAKLSINQISIEDQIDRKLAKSSQQASDKGVFYQKKVLDLEGKLQTFEQAEALEKSSTDELRALNADVLTTMVRGNTVLLTWKKNQSKKSRQSVEAFLKLRLQKEKLEVIHTVKI